MTKKRTVAFGLVGLLGMAAAVGASQLGGSSNLHATETNTWKHFAAVMPTDTTKGIRDYWTDCVSQGPLFSAPEGIVAEEATLTDAQIASILDDEDDSRIIPTLTEIKRSVAKGYDGKTSTQGYDVTTAYNYVYLDDTTKALVTNADETKITSAYKAYNARFAIMDLPLVKGDGNGTVNGFSTNQTYVDGYGEVSEVKSGYVSGDTEWFTVKYVDETTNLSDYESISFFVYNPTDTTWSDVRVNASDWSATLAIHSIAPHTWQEFTFDRSWLAAHGGSKFTGWWLAVLNWKGYESATETLKVSKPVAKKIDAVISDFMDETTVSATDANSANTTFAYGNDEAKGKVFEFTCAKNGGYAEFKLEKPTINSAFFDTVSFSIKTEFKVSFWLCKGSWWMNQYDFATNAFMEGQDQALTYRAETSSGWSTLTMSVADFNACNYLGFKSWDSDGAIADVTGLKVYISTISAHKISA